MVRTHRQFNGYLSVVYSSPVTFGEIVFDHKTDIPFVLALLGIRIAENSSILHTVTESPGIEPEDPINIISRRIPPQKDSKSLVGIVRMLLKAGSSCEPWILANVKCHLIASLFIQYSAKIDVQAVLLAAANRRGHVFSMLMTMSGFDLRHSRSFMMCDWKQWYNAKLYSFVRKDRCRKSCLP